MDGAPVAPALAVDEQGTLPWARHYAQPTLHIQEGLVCWGTFLGEVGDSGFKPRLDPQPTPPGRGREGLGVFCGPAAQPEVVGDRTPTPPRGSLGLGVWTLLCPYPRPVLTLDSYPRPVLTLDSCVARAPARCLWARFPSPIQTGFHVPQAQTWCNGPGRPTRGRPRPPGDPGSRGAHSRPGLPVQAGPSITAP